MTAIHYSRGFGESDATPEQRVAEDFATFRTAVLADRATAKNQQWIIGGCEIAPADAIHLSKPSKARSIGKPHRCGDCAKPRRFVGLDVDEKPTPMTAESFFSLVEHLQRYSGFVYTTASHTPAKPRCRVVLELDAELPRAELIKASQAIKARLNEAMVADGYRALPFDSSTDRPEQPLYLALTDSQVFELDGDPVCVAEVLADFPALEAPRVAPVASLGEVVESDRHAAILKETQMLADDVRRGHMTRDEALAVMRLRRDGGRYTRAVPDDEFVRALDGAIGKSHAALVEDDPAPVGLAAVPLTDIMDTEPEPPRFVIDPLVPRRVATLLGGHGGVGKSMLALIWGAHVACGRAWGPFPVTPCQVVYVSLEDDSLIVRYRLRRIIEAYALPVSEVTANLQVFDGSDVEAALVVERCEGGVTSLTETATLAALEDAVGGAGFVLIDNASDAYGANENARLQVRGFMRRLAGIARANDAGLVLLAHIDKHAAKQGSKDNSYSGSTAWHNSARSRAALVDDGNGIELRHEKANWGAKAEPLQLARAEHGVLHPIPKGERSVAAALIAANDADAIEAVMAALLADGVTIPAAETGQHTTYHALSRAAEFGEQYRGTDGKVRVKTALVALERAGRIQRETYQTPRRKPGERWALAQPDAQKAA